MISNHVKYCKECLMPDTRPGLKFRDGVCVACVHYKQRKTVNWKNRNKELEKICKKFRGKNGDGYDCAIAVSGGKDSHYQVYYMKEVMKMNPADHQEQCRASQATLKSSSRP